MHLYLYRSVPACTSVCPCPPTPPPPLYAVILCRHQILLNFVEPRAEWLHDESTAGSRFLFFLRNTNKNTKPACPTDLSTEWRRHKQSQRNITHDEAIFVMTVKKTDWSEMWQCVTYKMHKERRMSKNLKISLNEHRIHRRNYKLSAKLLRNPSRLAYTF